MHSVHQRQGAFALRQEGAVYRGPQEPTAHRQVPCLRPICAWVPQVRHGPPDGGRRHIESTYKHILLTEGIIYSITTLSGSY